MLEDLRSIPTMCEAVLTRLSIAIIPVRSAHVYRVDSIKVHNVLQESCHSRAQSNEPETPWESQYFRLVQWDQVLPN